MGAFFHLGCVPSVKNYELIIHYFRDVVNTFLGFYLEIDINRKIVYNYACVLQTSTRLHRKEVRR